MHTPIPAHQAPALPDIPQLCVRTRPLDRATRLWSIAPDTGGDSHPSAWVREGEGHLGWGTAASIRTDGADRFTAAESWWAATAAAARIDDTVCLPGSGLTAFGSFAFSADSPAGGILRVPSIVVGCHGGRGFVTTVIRHDEPDSAHDRLAETLCVRTTPDGPGEVAFFDGALPGPLWESAVAEAVARIGDGALDKVVLARDLLAEAQTDIDIHWLLRRLAAEYSRTWVFSVDGLVGATPEMLCRLERGLVTSRVLAGTIRRTGDDEGDLTLAASLARSSKDLEEHEYAVRSVAEALTPHCTSMNTPETPFVLHLPNVMHLATDVTGRLRNGVSSIALAESLHPSAAVCGTPRETAFATIAELEKMDRGRYAGPVGWVDASGDGEWGIALRCGLLEDQDPRRMRLFAGCGIVAGSDPAAELAESDAKLVPMRSALARGSLA